MRSISASRHLLFKFDLQQVEPRAPQLPLRVEQRREVDAPRLVARQRGFERELHLRQQRRADDLALLRSASSAAQF